MVTDERQHLSAGHTLLPKLHVRMHMHPGAELLEREKSATFTLEQDVAQGCSRSPILFINDEVEKADFEIQLGGGKKVGGMVFTDDFVGIQGRSTEVY